jgi:intracellular sulfur oxidation DsrE/DsrF family protein
MKIKAVLHIDWDQEDRLKMALNNISNLIHEITAEEADVYLVVNGHAVNLLRRERSVHYAAKIKKLSEMGVHFLVCNSSLTSLGVDRSELIRPCEIVPAGIMELIRLQQEGFAYIKP